MKRISPPKKLMLFAGVFFLLMAYTGCSDDDDAVLAERPSGSIQVNEYMHLSEGHIIVQKVTAGQDSWLAAVPEGEENSNNFIAEPVFIEEGSTSNVQLTFEESVITDPSGHKVVLKLYADNQNNGILGEWDSTDEPIMLANDELLIKTITIFPENTEVNWYEYYDSNEDGTIDIEEFSRTYHNIFEFAEIDHITFEQFYSMMFHTTNTNHYDDGITETEWNEGYLRMFGNWVEDNFSEFDTNENDHLDQEEWQDIFEESEWFESYDTNSDNLITKEELNIGFFNDWDLNNDGSIDEEEFDLYRPFVAGLSFNEPMM